MDFGLQKTTEETSTLIIKSEDSNNDLPHINPKEVKEVTRKIKKKKGYHQVSNETREEILRRVLLSKEKVSQVRQKCTIVRIIWYPDDRSLEI